MPFARRGTDAQPRPSRTEEPSRTDGRRASQKSFSFIVKGAEEREREERRGMRERGRRKTERSEEKHRRADGESRDEKRREREKRRGEERDTEREREKTR